MHLNFKASRKGCGAVKTEESSWVEWKKANHTEQTKQSEWNRLLPVATCSPWMRLPQAEQVWEKCCSKHRVQKGWSFFTWKCPSELCALSPKSNVLPHAEQQKCSGCQLRPSAFTHRYKIHSKVYKFTCIIISNIQ